jgi:phenylalanyl-tRNA synthetase alpha chain
MKLQTPENFNFQENEIYSVIREQGGDLIEKVELVDFFANKKAAKISRCYRIHYRSLERTLMNEEIDRIQLKIREDFVKELGLELR